jgi:PAS domain S-box-containing protein
MTQKDRRARFRFRLYISGSTVNSLQAVGNLNQFCREQLAGRHDIEIVDVLKEPLRALDDGVLMTPTLVKMAPSPTRRIVGHRARGARARGAAPVTQVEGSAGDPTAELLALVETLDATERRIEELTAGEVDSLMARDGRTFLLRRAQEQLRRNEAVRQSAILDALPARIALLDAQGVIISANAAWHAFEMFASPGTADGDNYVTACASLPGDAGENHRRVAAGIRTVLDGHAPSFSMEYAGLAPGPRRWFLTTVTPLGSERSGGVVVMHLETTAKWAAEESLRSSEVRFRELAESINDVFFLREAGTDAMLYVSPAYEEVWGRSCASLYADPRSRIDSVYPSDVPITLEMDATRARGEQSCFEYRIVRPDGAVRWIESRGYPVRDDAGVVRRTAGVAKDITVAKQALEKLQESEARFRTLTEASFDAIMITQDGLVLEVNAGFERMFAYPASDAVGRPVIDFYAPESVDAVRLHSVDGTSGTRGVHHGVARHDRAAPPRGPVPAGAEDGRHRAPGGRCRARLQQPARRHHRLRGVRA